MRTDEEFDKLFKIAEAPGFRTLIRRASLRRPICLGKKVPRRLTGTARDQDNDAAAMYCCQYYEILDLRGAKVVILLSSRATRFLTLYALDPWVSPREIGQKI